jgi:4-amino-4-deoxy-L-arabinose transferase-like glycosyltransferase
MLSTAANEADRPAASPFALTRAEWASLALVLFVAAALRSIQLARVELWFDEAFSALVAMEPVSALVAELAGDTSPPFYFLLLRAWRLLFGGDAWTLRVLSVVFGLLGVLAMFVAGQRLWGPRAGLAAAALLAVSPLHVYYSREVRPYALLVVLALASLVALDAMAHDGRRRVLSAYCLATAAAIWTHSYGLLLLVAPAVWVAVGQLPLAAAVRANAIVVVTCLPWLPVLARQASSDATRWVARLWLETPPAMAPLLSLAGFSVGGWIPPYIASGSDALPVWMHAVAYGVFALLVATALLRGRTAAARRVAVTGGLMLGVPIAVSFARPMFLVGRHDVIVLPLFLLLAGRGLTLLEPRQASAIAAAVAVLAGTASYRYQTLPAPVASYGRAALLRQHAAPGDAVLATGFTRNSLEYIVREEGSAIPFFSFPTSFGVHRGWVDERELADPALLQSDADRLVGTFRIAVDADGLLWVVHARELAAANEILFARLGRSFHQVSCPGDAEAQGVTCWRRRP